MPGVGDLILAADVNTLIAATYQRPRVKLAQTTGQSFASGTTVPVTFDVELADTHNYHSTVSNTSRVTPTKAGVYLCIGTLTLVAATTTTSVHGLIGKNGTGVDGSFRHRPNNTNVNGSVLVVAEVDVNGTTDFIELLGVQVDSGAAARLAATTVGQRPSLEVVYVRDL